MFRRNRLRRGRRLTIQRRRTHPFEQLEDRRVLATYVNVFDLSPDGGGCGDLANPCNDIQAGVDNSAAGDEVYVAAGFYSETVTITKDLHVRGEAGGVVVNGVVNGFDIMGGVDVKLEDLTITGSAIGIRAAGVGNIELEDVNADLNTADGLAVLGASSVVIRGGRYDDNGLNGMTLDTISGDVLIVESNLVGGAPARTTGMGNGGYGLDVRVAGNVTVFRGDFTFNGLDGMHITDVGPGGISIAGVNASLNTVDGVDIVDSLGLISIDDSDLSSNTFGSGLNINNTLAGEIVLRDVRALSNGGKGAAIVDVASVFDTNGDYRDNADGGMVIIDVLDTVTLYNTTATDNVTEGIKVARDLNPTSASSVAVLGGFFADTVALAKPQAAGIQVFDVASEVELTKSFGPTGSDVTVMGHASEGVLLEGGARAKIEGGVFTLNLTGMVIRGFGEVEIEDATATMNVAEGLAVMGGGPATVTGGTYDSNGASGLFFDALALATVNNGRGLTANINGDDGLFAMGLGELFVSGGSFSGNVDTGLTATLATNVVFSGGVTATGNATGALISNIMEGFNERDGNYSLNDDHGVHLEDIGGVAVLTRTTADNNDANFDGTGDGLLVSKLVNPFAVGFDLVVAGGSYSDTDGPGGAVQQQHGVFATDIGGAVFLVPANDPGDDLTVTGNRKDGAFVADAGLLAAVRADFSDNSGIGLNVTSFPGGLDLRGIISDRNGARGLEVSATGPVLISDSTFDDTATLEGIKLAGVGDVALFNVSASRSGSHGLQVLSASSLIDEAGVFSENDASGIELVSVGDDVTLSGTYAFDNAADGLTAGTIGGQLAIFDAVFSAVDGPQGRGISVDSVAGDITVMTSDASGNTMEGVRIGSGLGTADVNFGSSTFNSNGDNGVTLSDVANVSFDSVIANMNGDDGVHIVAPANFVDVLGSYNTNDNHGVHLTDIAGDVKLRGTVASFNDADLNGVGDGIHIDTSALALGGAAVAGNFILDFVTANGSVHGVWLESVGGATILLDVEASENDFDGVNVEDGGSPISALAARTAALSPLPGIANPYSAIVRGGTFVDNGDEGLRLRSMDGDVRLDANPEAFLGLPVPRPITATLNGTDGVELDFFDNAEVYDVISTNNVVDGMNIGGGFDVDIDGGVFDENGNNGISVFSADDVSIANTSMDQVGVPAIFPLNAGIYVLSNTSVTLDNNTITNSDRIGTDIEMTPTVRFVTTADNVPDAVSVDLDTISHVRGVGTVDERTMDDAEYSDVTSLTIDTVDSDDTITVQLGAGLPAITVSGGEQGFTDTLTALRENPADVVTVTATIITDGASTIDYSEIEKVVVDDEGDFSFDGTFGLVDIDELVADIAAGNNTPQYELTGDYRVDLEDVARWLEIAGAANLTSGNPYLFGDANLDGFVDGQDFIAWNANKFTSTGLWSLADWNADGVSDGQDFIIWNGNKFQSSDARDRQFPPPALDAIADQLTSTRFKAEAVETLATEPRRLASARLQLVDSAFAAWSRHNDEGGWRERLLPTADGGDDSDRRGPLA